MGNWLARALVLGVVLLASTIKGATAPQHNRAPLVGVLTTNGLLLPLAYWSGTGWTGLNWPSRERLSGLDETKLPPIPRSVADIPAAWVAPLDSFPPTWRAQLVNAGSRQLRLGAPAPWDFAIGESIALAVDYRAPGIDGRFQSDAGIAVSGDVTTLPVRRLKRSAPEWRSLVEEHIGMFDRAQRIPSGARARPLPDLKRWLLRGEVDLWQVARTNRGGSFFYFEVTDGVMPKGPCAEARAFEGRIDVPAAGPSRVISIQPVAMTCGDINEVFEIVGAVSYQQVVRLVVLSGGEGGTGYQIVDPEKPLTWRW